MTRTPFIKTNGLKLAIACAALLSGPVANAQQADSGPPVSSGAEIVEADISTRTIPVDSAFAGKEIIVFGSISRPVQRSLDDRAYDVVVVVQGAPAPLVARQKSNVAGLWMNTTSINFDRVPSFYALSSTRQLNAIADPEVFNDLGIGFAHIRMTPRHPVENDELANFREAVIRLKSKQKLYLRNHSGVRFRGRTLFRSSVMLPANIPLGLMSAHVYLFRDRQLLSGFSTSLQLEREGVERWLHSLARRQSFLYGLLAVALALATGVLASEVSRRTRQ
jgi:uncharacterized protein (TIGR02186 family)